MKKMIVLSAVVILLIAGAFSSADDNDKHDIDSVLHTSMEELNTHMNMIFQSIIRSDYASLAKSAGVFNRIAENLKGTKPLKKQGDINDYNTFIEALRVRAYEFERVTKGKNPDLIAKSFGTILEICVNCHTRFRD